MVLIGDNLILERIFKPLSPELCIIGTTAFQGTEFEISKKVSKSKHFKTNFEHTSYIGITYRKMYFTVLHTYSCTRILLIHTAKLGSTASLHRKIQKLEFPYPPREEKAAFYLALMFVTVFS